MVGQFGCPSVPSWGRGAVLCCENFLELVLRLGTIGGGAPTVLFMSETWHHSVLEVPCNANAAISSFYVDLHHAADNAQVFCVCVLFEHSDVSCRVKKNAALFVLRHQKLYICLSKTGHHQRSGRGSRPAFTLLLFHTFQFAGFFILLRCEELVNASPECHYKSRLSTTPTAGKKA